MASDQNVSLIDHESDQTDSVIENQISTYRAISARAVFSLFFGIFALFSFAHWSFYLFSVLAIILGIWAKRGIRQYPDMLTGERLANAGIAMGLVFGLISGTYSGVLTFVRTREAARFAREYAEVLKSPSAGDALWYNIPPEQRKGKSGAQVLQEVEAMKTRERAMMEQKLGPLNGVRKRLTSSKDQDLHFLRIEDVGLDDTRGAEIAIYAVALFELNGPGSKEFPNQEFAAVILKAQPKGRHYDWWVEDFRYPYTLKSFAPAVVAKASDDGHGHAH